MAVALMDARPRVFTLGYGLFVRFLLIVCLLIASLGLFAANVQAIPYGSCEYSSEHYSDSGSCGNDALAGTGQDYLSLLYAVIGLLVFFAGMGAAVSILGRKQSRSEVS